MGAQGAAWGVTQDLAPGQEVVLTVGDNFYHSELSNLPAVLELGAFVYVQVDSWGDSPTFGAVNELDEFLGRPYRARDPDTRAHPRTHAAEPGQHCPECGQRL